MENRKTIAKGLFLLLLLGSLAVGLDYVIKERERNHRQIAALRTQIEHLQRQIEPESENNVRDIAAFVQHKYRRIPIEMAELIAIHIDRWSNLNDLNPAVVVGIIDVESDFNPLAVSNKGARGLMQVIPSYWAEELQISSNFDFHGIETNIRAGIYVYLKYLDMENNNIKRALNRYNGSDRDKGEYANKVYQAIGEFTAFRHLTAKSDKATGETTEDEASAVENTEKAADPETSPKREVKTEESQIIEADILKDETKQDGG